MSTTGAGREGSAPVLATDVPTRQSVRGRTRRTRPLQHVAASAYPHWFYLPAGVVFGLIFIVPTLLSFYFSLTRWTLFTTEFIGLDNFVQFFQEPSLTNGARNTIVYAVTTSGLKVVLGLLLATLLTSRLRSRNVLRSVDLLPGPREHRGRGDHVRRAHAPVHGADQPDPGGVRRRRPAVAHGPGHRAPLGGASWTSGRGSASRS